MRHFYTPIADLENKLRIIINEVEQTIERNKGRQVSSKIRVKLDHAQTAINQYEGAINILKKAEERGGK